MSNLLLIPQTRSDLDSPSNYFTPKAISRDSAFFDKSVSLIDDLGDYTYIDGILHEESLNSTKTQTQDTTYVEVEQNQSKNLDNNLVDLEINRNIVDFIYFTDLI